MMQAGSRRPTAFDGETGEQVRLSDPARLTLWPWSAAAADK